MLQRVLVLLTGWLLLGDLVPRVVAEDAQAIIKYRQSVLKAMGGEMSAMGTILRDQVRAENLAVHADNMQRLSVLLADQFPPGSDRGKTAALPAVWQYPEDFSRKMTAFEQAARSLAEVAATGDLRRTAAAAGQLGQSCKSCHDRYRAE